MKQQEYSFLSPDAVDEASRTFKTLADPLG